MLAHTSRRVLDIPELLDMVFGFLDDRSNASNASVCKRWSEIALDSLWRELDDLGRLFGILKPLKQIGESPDSPYVRLPPRLFTFDPLTNSRLSPRPQMPTTGGGLKNTAVACDD
jgi:hypothetical protein